MFHRRITLVEYQALTGSQLGVSSWIAIDQSPIHRFADATLDHQPSNNPGVAHHPVADRRSWAPMRRHLEEALSLSG